MPRRISRSGYRPTGGATPFRQEQADGEGRGTWESSSEQSEASVAVAVIVDNVTEEVGARPGLAEELLVLGGVPGHVVLVIQRTFYASGRPVETADVVIPADRYRVAYHLPVK